MGLFRNTGAFVHLPDNALLPRRLSCSTTNHASASSLLRLLSSPTDHPYNALQEGSVVGMLDGSSVPAGVIVYDPIMPSTETLLGMGLILLLCAMVAWVWQSQVVPTARTNLALSKRRGPVKEYLDELKKSSSYQTKEDEESSHNSTRRASNDSTIGEDAFTMTAGVEVGSVEKDKNRAFERWLFADWLQDNKSDRIAGRQKEPALPILKDAKWNSGDNPVLVATFLISLGVILTGLTERVASLTS